jgi:ribonuclease BN (tRNA processing enzyme)/MOSC domain-containing protein YiiM
LTILGHGPAPTQPDTPASGVLIEAGDTAVLFDCGQGVIRALRSTMDPRSLDAIVIGHMHADHYLDLAGLRYLFPWGERAVRRLPVHLPPGGSARLEALAKAISERPSFFDDAFEISEYVEGEPLTIGHLRVKPFASRHYVPAWSMDIADRDGHRVVYAGDTGPSQRLEDVSRGADMLILEATLRDPSEDDPARGHLTAAEALDIAQRASVHRVVLTHYPSFLRETIEGCVAETRLDVVVARPGVTIDLPAGPTGQGTITGIHIAPEAGADVVGVERIRAIPGRGLEGDRYARQVGFYSGDGAGDRDLTLIEGEVLDDLSARDGIQLPPGASRRNLTTRGIRLNGLVGRRFRIGKIECHGTRLCEPCDRLVELTGEPVNAPLVHRGGLRARILTEGEICVGDRIEVVEYLD